MEVLNEDCLIKIFQKLSFYEKVQFEPVCTRWHQILRNPSVFRDMQKLNLSDYLKDSKAGEYHDEANQALERTLNEVLQRGGPIARELTFDSRWLVITQPIISFIARHCHQLRKLDLGWIVLDADVSPLLDVVAEKLEELSFEETSWKSVENSKKVPDYFKQMVNLRRLNLRKFSSPLNGILGLPEQLEFLDVSEAIGLSPETLVEFFQTHPGLKQLCLSPVPESCLNLFAMSTTSAINQPGQFRGFVKMNSRDRTVTLPRQASVQNDPDQGQSDSSLAARKKKVKGMDLQSIFDAFKALKSLKTLSIGYICYSPQFLSLRGLEHLESLRNLYIKDCNALNADVLSKVLKKTQELRNLALSNCPNLDDHSPLAMCKMLVELEMEKSDHLSDSDLEKVARNGTLKRLRLRKCVRITDQSIVQVARCCLLRELEVSKCPNISEELFADAGAFAQLSLEKLSLNGTVGITNKSIAQMVKALKLDSLRELDLGLNNNLDDSAVVAIFERLRKEARRGKTLVVYAFQTGITREIQKKVAPEVELMF